MFGTVEFANNGYANNGNSQITDTSGGTLEKSINSCVKNSQITDSQITEIRN